MGKHADKVDQLDEVLFIEAEFALAKSGRNETLSFQLLFQGQDLRLTLLLVTLIIFAFSIVSPPS